MPVEGTYPIDTRPPMETRTLSIEPTVKVLGLLRIDAYFDAALWDYAEKNGIKIEGLKRPKHDIYDKD